MEAEWIIPYLKAQEVFSIIFNMIPYPVRALVILTFFVWGGSALLDILTTRT